MSTTSFDFSRYSWLTFDCYGTLIDWESGILGAIRPMLAASGRNLSSEGILELYAAMESREEAGPYRSYREILATIVRHMGSRLVFSVGEQQSQALGETIEAWRPFPDSVDALKRLKSRFKLAVISNIDDDMFVQTSRLLGDPFEIVVTAQQAQSYKPSLTNFRMALERIGEPAGKILHCAQSLFHDIAPAKQVGMGTCWVDRRAGKRGGGATPAAKAEPDLRVESMAELAQAAGV